ncbi:ABC transporter substrate-binding protein [Leeia aquatica]|uniref:ABC transporter substrate-binding protein n=1 Tax=Leeia aquatica TaxID=2725557 RepID=A0A847S461_9NEIS|nr:ABC transporter substrate-binding protein [Leeia aquatica]NLR74544.1 ABC transporter substrate-binding protein [Leeia aquatica]
MRAWLTLLLSGFVSVALWAAPIRVVFPRPETDIDVRDRYAYDLLQEALEHTRKDFGEYVLVRSSSPINRLRSVLALNDPNGEVNVINVPTSVSYEQALRPIRIPIDKGLLGYRLLLIRDKDQPRFDAIRNLDQLRQLRAGLQENWTITDVWRQAGFKVVTSSDYEPLFSMLSYGRFDYFLRGVDEIMPEWQGHHDKLPSLKIEQSLLVYLPLPRYFFTGRTQEGERLGQRIEAGLQRMRQDGRFEQMFQTYQSELLRGLKLQGRRVLRLENPNLPAETPLNDPSLWYSPLN